MCWGSYLTPTLQPYDANGNRLSANATPYVIDTDSNRLTSVGASAYGYDSGGNLTSNGTAAVHTYDSRNRLSAYKTTAGVTYTYATNALGQRVSKASTAISSGGRLYAYDGAGHLIGEYDNNRARQLEHVWLGDLPVVAIGGGGGIYPVLSDHLGTPRQIIDTNKQVRWLWDNLDPKTGRYTQSNPIGLAGGLNTFGYVGGNPVNAVDLWGLTPNPAEIACIAGPNPICDTGVIVDIATTILGGAMIADSLNDKAEKAKERKEYSRICKTPIIPTGDKCKDAQANLNRLKQCLQLREEFGRKWYNDADPGHEVKNQEIRTAIEKLDEWIRGNCGKQCN